MPQPRPGRNDCGGSLARTGRVRGRTNEVLIIEGVNIIPDYLGDALEKISGRRASFQLLVEREGYLDRLEVSEELFSDKMREQGTVVDTMQKKPAGVIGITPRVVLVEPGSIRRDEEASPNVIDRRPILEWSLPLRADGSPR